MSVFESIKRSLEQAIDYEKGDVTMARSESLIRISESDDWVVDYDIERGMYRVSYFEDGHFVDQCRFEPYEAKEMSMQQVLSDREYKVFKESINPKNVTFEDIKAAIDEFNRMCAESAKSDKDLYEEQMVKMLTNWDKQ